MLLLCYLNMHLNTTALFCLIFELYTVELYSVNSICALFCLILWNLASLLCIFVVCSFLLLYSIPLGGKNIYIKVYLHVLLLMDFQLFHGLWLLEIMPLFLFLYILPEIPLLSSQSGIHLEAGWLTHSGLCRSFLVLAPKAPCPGKSLGPRQTDMVGYPV